MIDVIANAIHEQMVKANPGFEVTRMKRGTDPWSSIKPAIFLRCSCGMDCHDQSTLVTVKLMDGTAVISHGLTRIEEEITEMMRKAQNRADGVKEVPGWTLPDVRASVTVEWGDPELIPMVLKAMESAYAVEVAYLMYGLTRRDMNHVLRTNKRRSKSVLKRYMTDLKASE